MTYPTPADELRAAARLLRLITFVAPPEVAPLARACSPLADLLDAAALDAEEGRPDTHALAVARAITEETA